METHYNSSTKYTEYTSNSNDLDIVRTEKYNIIINSVTGGWAEVKDSELALLMFGESFYDMNFGEKAYQAGLIKKNGSYIFDLNEVNHSINKLYMFEFRVTDMCNLNCIYCSSEACNSNSERPNLKIAYQWVDRVYEYIKEKKVRSVSIEFTGGEPLLFTEYLEELINYASTKFQQITGLNVNYVICTNGTLLEDKHINLLKKIKNRAIQVSLDGSSEINDKQRPYHSGKGSYDIVTKNIDILRQNNIKVNTVASVITKDSQDNIPEIAKLILDIGCEKMTLQPMCQVGRASREKRLVLDGKIYVDKIFEAIDQVILPYWKTHKRRIFIRNLSITYAYLLKPWRKYMCQRCPCGSGINIISTDYKGNVYGCNTGPFDDCTIFGNITDSSFTECLNSKNAKKFRNRNLNNIEECNRCEVKAFCQGGCPKSALSIYHDINKPGDICEINKYLIIKAMESLIEERYPKDMILGMAKSFLFEDVETI